MVAYLSSKTLHNFSTTRYHSPKKSAHCFFKAATAHTTTKIMMMMSPSITVPTKTYDGGSKRNHTVDDSADGCKDAFSKYSNTLVRMQQLLMLDDEDMKEFEEDDLSFLAPLNDALRSAGISVEPSKRRKIVHERKTRLSWEVHPSLLLDNFLIDQDLSDDAANVSDDEDGASDEQGGQSGEKL